MSKQINTGARDLLKYHVCLYWGQAPSLVADCETSATIAYEITKAFLAESFAGVEHKAWREGELETKLQPLLVDPYGRHSITLEWREKYAREYGSATARAVITPL